MSSLENPFHPPLKGSGETDTEKDIKLVQKLLGDEDAALLASVRGGKQGHHTETMPDDVMTDEEREMLAKAEHAEGEAREQRENLWDRERYVEWAESIGRDEGWVNRSFVFNTNGTVEKNGALDLDSITSLPSFPPNLTTVRGFLDLVSLTSADNLTLPQSVGDSLNLRSLTIADNLTLPQAVGDSLDLYSFTSADNLTLPQTVGGSLILYSLTSAEHTVWPKHIGRDLIIPRAFSAQAEQLKASGVLKGRIIYTD